MIKENFVSVCRAVAFEGFISAENAVTHYENRAVTVGNWVDSFIRYYGPKKFANANCSFIAV
jgi:hypothetical protein